MCCTPYFLLCFPDTRLRLFQWQTHSDSDFTHPRVGGGPPPSVAGRLTSLTSGTPRLSCGRHMSFQVVLSGHRHARGQTGSFLSVPFQRRTGSILSQCLMACAHLRSQILRERRVHWAEVSTAYRPCCMRRIAFRAPFSFALKARLHSLAGSSNGSIWPSLFSSHWSITLLSI